MVLPVPGQMQTAEKSLEYGLFPDNTPEKVKRLVDSLQSISFNLQALEKQVDVAMADYRKIGLARAQAETAEQNYQLVYDAYLVGEVSLLNLLDAQSERVSANASATMVFYTFLSDLPSARQAVGYFPFVEPRDEVENRI